MNIQLLETFLVVCEEGNLGRAAVRLFRTQPAITRQIQALEEDLGVRLLERTSRGVLPTAEGQELRVRSARILGELRDLRDLGVQSEGPTGDLVLACSDTVACHFLAPLLGRFTRQHPRVHLRIENGVTPAISNLVERGSCDLGFVLLPLHNSRLELKPVLRYHHVAAFASGQAPKAWRMQSDVQRSAGRGWSPLAAGAVTTPTVEPGGANAQQRESPRYVYEMETSGHI